MDWRMGRRVKGRGEWRVRWEGKGGEVRTLGWVVVVGGGGGGL